MKRQGLIVTIKELERIIRELEVGCLVDDKILETKFQINIINKEGFSDTWRIE